MKPTNINQIPSKFFTQGIKLVAVDMDGTLLTPTGQFPPGLSRLIARCQRLGVEFVPASGRQHHMLADMFAPFGHDMTFVGDNGGTIIEKGVTKLTAALPADVVTDAIDIVRQLRQNGWRGGMEMGSVDTAFIEEDDPDFVSETHIYNASLTSVPDLHQVTSPINKIGIFDFTNPTEKLVGALTKIGERASIVLAGPHWVDIVPGDSNKGVALRCLQADLGATTAQTVAFGDFENDIEMLQAADLSFAMANAHPHVIEVARFGAPSNSAYGVISTTNALLDRVEGHNFA